MHMCYNYICLDEQNTGALCFSEAAVIPQIEFVGKVPSMCGLTSLAVRLGNGSAHGGHFVMSKQIKLTQSENTFALVDDEDYLSLIKHAWAYDGRYVHRSTTTKQRKTIRIYMHREILSAPKGIEVDHINGNTLDNRRQNLRFATRVQNCRNVKKRKKGTSKYKGVFLDKVSGKWKVRANHKDRGIFTNEIEAAKYYDKIAREEFGEFARTNFEEDL